MSLIWGLHHKEDEDTLYHGIYCMKNFCTSLRKESKNIIDLEKKKMLLLAKEELKSHKDAKICYISGKESLKNSLKFYVIGKLVIIVIIQVNIQVLHIVFVI